MDAYFFLIACIFLLPRLLVHINVISCEEYAIGETLIYIGLERNIIVYNR